MSLGGPSIITAGPCRSELDEGRGRGSISRASLLASLLDGLSHYFVILSWDARSACCPICKLLRLQTLGPRGAFSNHPSVVRNLLRIHPAKFGSVRILCLPL
jgi:hypothetical protein